MNNSVAQLLNDWRLRLLDTVPNSEAELNLVLDLPDPEDSHSIEAIGLRTLTVKYGPSLSADFLEPVLFSDIKNLFGEGSPGVRGPGRPGIAPYCYDTDKLGFTFFLQNKIHYNS